MRDYLNYANCITLFDSAIPKTIFHCRGKPADDPWHLGADNEPTLVWVVYIIT